MKKFLKLSAGVLATGMAITLAGCGGCTSCMGCAGNTQTSVLTNSNWYTDTSYSGIQPTFIIEQYPDYAEHLVYDVTFDKEGASNASYSISYNDGGKYESKFYATYFDWNNGLDKEGYKADKKETVYCLETILTLSGKFTFTADGTEKEFSNSTQSICYFRSAGSVLQPVYSAQIIDTLSPKNFTVSSADEMTEHIEIEYKNYYSIDGKEVTSVAYEDGKETTAVCDLEDADNSLFDNIQLYTAVRAIFKKNLETEFSKKISIYSPLNGGITNQTVAGVSDKPLPDEERKAVTQLLADNGLYNKDGSESINTVCVNINLSADTMQGTTQTAWYAGIEDSEYNISRSMLLKLSIPLSYRLGTLNFSLSEIKSTMWNK